VEEFVATEGAGLAGEVEAEQKASGVSRGKKGYVGIDGLAGASLAMR
jgi:hypothetical protein